MPDDGADTDTILVVLFYDDAGNVIGSLHNDNCTTSTKASCLNPFYFAAQYDHIRILVFAPYFLFDGTTDVWLDGVQLADDVYFGGSVVHVESGVPPDWYSINTVHQHDESFDTRLYLFDENWTYVDQDDDGGIQYAAEIEGPWLEPDMHVLVAAYSAGSDGYTTLIINDCVYSPSESGASHCHSNGADTDSDSLADSLEADIGTLFDDRDSDDDGLYDFFEVIGRDVDTVNSSWYDEEPLVSEGADPLHRDIFVEMDTRDDWQCYLSETEFQAMQDLLVDMPEADNPDGTTGINIHFDSGTNVCSDYSLCGSYGGHSVEYYEHGADAMAHKAVKGDDDGSPNMKPVRWGLYHYFYLRHGTCTGQTVAAGKMSSYVCDGSDGEECYRTSTSKRIMHELGHQFFLQHWGDGGGYLADPTGVNYKPNYPSLMNYAFSYANMGFSHGDMATLDHTNLDEHSYSPNESHLYLYGKPFYFRSLASDGIDWNDDGREQASNVRFDLSPQAQVAGGHWPFEVGVQETFNEWPYVVPTGGPGLVQPAGDSDLYAFAVLTTDFPFPDYEGLNWWKTTSPDAAWSSHHKLSIPFTPDPDGETAAGFIYGTYSHYAIAVLPDTSGHLWYVQFNPATDQYVRSDPIPQWPAGVTARQATITRADNGIAVVFRDQVSGDLYYRKLDELYHWSAWEILGAANGLPVDSLQTPGLVRVYGKEYLLTSYVNELGNPDYVGFRLYSRDSGTSDEFSLVLDQSGLFVGFSDTAIDVNVNPQDRARLNLVFLPQVFADGSTLSSGDGYLAVYYSADGRWRHTYISGYLDNYGDVEITGDNNGWRAAGDVPAALERGSPGVVVWEGQARVVYVTDEPTDPYDSDSPGEYLEYVPHGNGIAETGYLGVMDDNNDQQMIANNLCTVWDIVGDYDNCQNSAMPQGVYIPATEATCQDMPLPP